MEMCKITHNNYDRISDKVMWLGAGLTLNFVVDLFYIRKSVNGEYIKNNFHKEVIYKSDNDYKVKIIRDFNYYFTIDYNDGKNIKTTARIGVDNLYFLIFNLKKVLNWFTGEDGINKIFSSKNGKIIIPTHPDSIKIQLVFNTSIEFEAAIGNINGYETIGCNVFINDIPTPVFVSYTTIFSLYQMLTTCNMYMMAQNMLNYIRPELGTNVFDMTKANANKQIKTNKSFFNMVGAKNNNP